MDTVQKFALGIAVGAALVGGTTVGLVKSEAAKGGRAAKRCKHAWKTERSYVYYHRRTGKALGIETEEVCTICRKPRNSRALPAMRCSCA